MQRAESGSSSWPAKAVTRARPGSASTDGGHSRRAKAGMRCCGTLPPASRSPCSDTTGRIRSRPRSSAAMPGGSRRSMRVATSACGTRAANARASARPAAAVVRRRLQPRRTACSPDRRGQHSGGVGRRPRAAPNWLRNGGRVSSAQFDRSGEYVVTGADDAIARVWRVRPQRLVSVLRGHTDGVLRARFSPDGTQVVTGSDDGSARLWPARPDTPTDPAWQRADSTAFSPKNSRDVLVVQGGRRAVWNTETGAIMPLSGGILVPDVRSWPCGRAVGCSPWSPTAASSPVQTRRAARSSGTPGRER